MATELPKGVTLGAYQPGVGGIPVLLHGEQVGWLHANGKRYNAYLRTSGVTGTPLGCFPQVEAATKIAIAAGWPGPAR